MKSVRTEYEVAEETVTRVKCNNCEERWDSRGNEDSMVVALNVQLREKSLSRWRSQDFNSMIHRDATYKIIAEEVADFCEACWSERRLGPTIEVNDIEHHVEEKEVIEYHCDFCDKNMGQSSDNEVTVNPRIIEFKRVYGNASTDRRDIVSHGIDERIYTSVSRQGKKKYEAEHDGTYDCCDECADEIFDREMKSNHVADERRSFWKWLLPFFST